VFYQGSERKKKNRAKRGELIGEERAFHMKDRRSKVPKVACSVQYGVNIGLVSGTKRHNGEHVFFFGEERLHVLASGGKKMTDRKDVMTRGERVTIVAGNVMKERYPIETPLRKIKEKADEKKKSKSRQRRGDVSYSSSRTK